MIKWVSLCAQMAFQWLWLYAINSMSNLFAVEKRKKSDTDVGNNQPWKIECESAWKINSFESASNSNIIVPSK